MRPKCIKNFRSVLKWIIFLNSILLQRKLSDYFALTTQMSKPMSLFLLIMAPEHRLREQSKDTTVKILPHLRCKRYICLHLLKCENANIQIRGKRQFVKNKKNKIKSVSVKTFGHNWRKPQGLGWSWGEKTFSLKCLSILK